LIARGVWTGFAIYKTKIPDIKDCMAVACGANNTLFTDSDGFLQGCGKFENLILNSFGESHDTLCQYDFAPVMLNKNAAQPKIRMVSMHKDTAVAVTDDGEVYVCGDSTVQEGESGDGIPTDQIIRKRGWFQVDVTYFLDEKVNMADVGTDHTLFLSEKGSVFHVGNEFIGNLIHHAVEKPNLDEIDELEMDQEILSPSFFQHNNKTEKIEMISTGSEHNLALSVTGSVYSWGRSNDFGQLGRGDKDANNKYMPVKILPETFIPQMDETDKVVFVKAFENSSMLVTESGWLYVFGEDEYGKLGSGDTIDSLRRHSHERPRRVAFDFDGNRVVMVACASSFTVAVTDNGALWGCGKQNLYVEGVRGNKMTSTFEKINSDAKEKFVTVAIGDSGSDDEVHWMAITEKQHMFACGDNSYGKRGVSFEENKKHKLVQVHLETTETKKAGRFGQYFEPEDNLAVAMAHHERLGNWQVPKLSGFTRFVNHLKRATGMQVILPTPTPSLFSTLSPEISRMISEVYTNPPPHKNSIAPGIRRLMGEGWNGATPYTLHVGFPRARVCLRCLHQTA
jgi:alpha-tubulin suppressor-like RCC1 family protein